MAGLTTTIKESMTPLPITVEEGTLVSQAQTIMSEHVIRHLPVLRDGAVVGIISERDLFLTSSLCDKFGCHDDIAVGDVCVRNPYIVDGGELLEVVMLRMAEEKIGSAVIAEQGAPIGIFTTTNACRWAAAKILSDKKGL